MAVSGSFNLALVLLSVVIATGASYTALDLAGRLRVSRGRTRLAWLTLAAVTMGGGIWSMHFVAMLAFVMPMPVSYDLGLTSLSLVVAVVVTGLGFWAVSRGGVTVRAILVGGLLMGAGICSMHYIGMAAMRMHATFTYDKALVAVSFLIAAGASVVALRLSLASMNVAQRAGGAVAMGAAIAGMHYTGMAAIVFTMPEAIAEAAYGLPLPQINLAIAVAVVTFLVLFMAEVSSLVDRRLAAAAAREAQGLRTSEARVRAVNLDLERRVAEQTAELTTANARLTEALAQRTRALQDLARSEAEFRTSFEAAPVGKAQVDPASARILRANPAFERMLGYEPGELVGRTAWEFTWPEDRAGDIAEYSRFLSGETAAYVREKRYLRRDGQPVWGRISGSLVRSVETGQATLMVAVIEDIDERYKSQVALQAAKQELEVVVMERTNALRQRDLLLREVYHRVKNNLQLIDSLLVMQARQLADPQAKAALLGLRGRIHALGLVHHQLMGSANLQTFNIEPFLRELSSNILESRAQAGINLSVRAAPLNVGLDFAIPLGLLVTELVTNSLKHAFPSGMGNITVSLEQGEDSEVVLVVSDDGRGRGEEQVTGGASKAGLGSIIIDGLTAQLKGKVTMQSNKGTRTEIRIAEPALS
jgi:PAS domain S-box-containing protein